MALSRYKNDLQIRGGKILQTNESVVRVRRATQGGQLLIQQRVLQEGERLDIIAGQIYGDGRLWWIIAAANPELRKDSFYLEPGTQVRVPNDAISIVALYNDFNK